MKFTIRTQCGECERPRRFELVMGTMSSWYQCPKCGESFGLEMSKRAAVKPGNRIA